jgi:FkbM family methyltransferase
VVKAFDLVELDEPLNLMDVGAAAISEIPIYRSLMDLNMGKLHAFDGDRRQIAGLVSTYGDQVSIFSDFLFDGTERDLYVADALTGMTSLLRPSDRALKFFNGFEQFGEVRAVERVKTRRLDDIPELPLLDFVKLDIQGAELTVLKNGLTKLRDCLAVQLEVSFVCLYESQPSFGELDLWMRSQGYLPHCFLHVKRWSIAPTIFDGDFRIPGNQLLESDIVYIRNPLALEELSSLQLAKFAALSHYCFNSSDLCVRILLELVRRGELDGKVQEDYYSFLRRQRI